MRIVALTTGVAAIAVGGLLFLHLARPGGYTSTSTPVLRGEPIQPSPQTNQPAEIAGTAQGRKKKYPKPASFQRRMVEYDVNLAAGNTAPETQGFSATTAKVIFTPAQLKALPEPALPPGYARIGFERLSAFPFEATREMADGSNDLASASAATLARIPPSIRAFDKHLVATRGFLLPLKMNNGLAVEALLMRNQNMCCFGTVPKVNEWIAVAIPGEGTRPVMDEPVTILGRLHVGDIRENGYLVGIYRMEAEKIYWPGENP